MAPSTNTSCMISAGDFQFSTFLGLGSTPERLALRDLLFSWNRRYGNAGKHSDPHGDAVGREGVCASVEACSASASRAPPAVACFCSKSALVDDLRSAAEELTWPFAKPCSKSALVGSYKWRFAADCPKTRVGHGEMLSKFAYKWQSATALASVMRYALMH